MEGLRERSGKNASIKYTLQPSHIDLIIHHRSTCRFRVATEAQDGAMVVLVHQGSGTDTLPTFAWY